MARTKEMKLHHVVINGRNVECFYDTHIRSWTAYVRRDDGTASACGYGVSKAYAIDELACIDEGSM